MSHCEQIKAQLKTAISTSEQRWSAINTLIITTVIVTPLCGFLFQCGCDWPWSGLDSHCNFYKPYVQHHCPWCASMITGILSTGLAIIAGVWFAAQSRYSLSYGHVVIGISIRTVTGIMVFISLDELLPSAREYGEHHLSIYGLVAGMIVMSISLLLFT